MASAVSHRLRRAGPTLLRGLAVGLIAGAAVLIGALEGLERWGVNFQFLLRGPILPQTPIVIVSIDEDSFDELDLQWPWPPHAAWSTVGHHQPGEARRRRPGSDF